MDTTGKAFIEHWDWAADKGLMNRSTASSLRSSSAQVMSVLDNWEQIDMRELDVEDAFNRFKNLKSKEYTPKTLQVYLRRFKQAVASFLDYANEPSKWKPISRQQPNSKPENVSEARPKRVQQQSNVHDTSIAGRPQSGLIDYPYPLRENLVVHLHLPADLKLSEVRRLAAFLRTLTVEYEVTDGFESQ